MLFAERRCAMVSQSLDPKYLQLYREYSSTIRAFENATKDRRRVRAQFEARKKAPPNPRRPVGSPRDFRIPRRKNPAASQIPLTRERKVYLGTILGWAKIIYTSPPSTDSPDATMAIDANKIYDDMSLKLYWNAKNRYDNAKRAYFDYVRGQNIERHHANARRALSHAANLQLLGAESADGAALEEARAEVEKAAKNAWAIYQTSPSPKSDEVKVLLLESCEDVQLIGLDDSTVAKSIEGEIVRLFNAGALGMVKK
jgi:hypothetical protein